MLADTNVVLDVLLADPTWAEWSSEQLVLNSTGPLWVNSVIYAELAGSYRSIDMLELALAELGLELIEIPRQALFLAGQTYRTYRERGGGKTRVLADFLIGAHAFVAEAPLLTRNGRDFRSRFPRLKVISPEP